MLRRVININLRRHANVVALVFVGFAFLAAIATIVFLIDNEGNRAEATAGLAAALAALATFLIMFRQIVDQQNVLRLQTRLMCTTALVEAENSKIAEAKAIIETLWKGEDIPLRHQEVPSQTDVFDQLEKQLETMISDIELRASAREQLRKWKKAAASRADAIDSLESISREARRQVSELS